MNDLKIKVGLIESSLQQSSRELDMYEVTGRAEIGQEVLSMRHALLEGNQRIKHVRGELRSCMQLINDRPANVVDLKPQIAWLNTNIKSILTDFQTAEDKAQAAMTKTMTYANKVNDVSQDVAVQERELDVAQRESQQLADRAEEQLRTSERYIDEAETNLMQKTQDITDKIRDAADLRAKLTGLQKSLQQKRETLATAKVQAEKKKDKAMLGFATALVGIGFAPLTGGLSLLATGAGVGFGAGMAHEYNQLKDQISSAESEITSLISRIKAAEDQVKSLTSEKVQLQSRVSDLQMDINRQKVAQVGHRNQITKLNSVQSDITSLHSHATATSSSVKIFAQELLQLKQALNECAMALNQQSTELHVKTYVMDRFRTKSSRQNIELAREKAAIVQVTDVLAQISGKIPSMLPTSQLKFLDLKTGPNSVDISTEGQISIPGAWPRE